MKQNKETNKYAKESWSAIDSKCGGLPYHRWYKCQANKEICRQCKQIGYYEKCCRSTNTGDVEVEESPEDGSLGLSLVIIF